MAKKTGGVDIMRYVPLAVLAVSAVSGYTFLQARMSNAEEKLRGYEVVQATLTSDSANIRVSQAKTETKVDSMLELLKDIKKKV